MLRVARVRARGSIRSRQSRPGALASSEEGPATRGKVALYGRPRRFLVALPSLAIPADARRQRDSEGIRGGKAPEQLGEAHLDGGRVLAPQPRDGEWRLRKGLRACSGSDWTSDQSRNHGPQHPAGRGHGVAVGGCGTRAIGGTGGHAAGVGVTEGQCTCTTRPTTPVHHAHGHGAGQTIGSHGERRRASRRCSPIRLLSRTLALTSRCAGARRQFEAEIYSSEWLDRPGTDAAGPESPVIQEC